MPAESLVAAVVPLLDPPHPRGLTCAAADHSGSAHWVMVEILERLTGLAFVDYYRSRVLDPMGLDGFWCGVPEELQPALDIADVVRGP